MYDSGSEFDSDIEGLLYSQLHYSADLGSDSDIVVEEDEESERDEEGQASKAATMEQPEPKTNNIWAINDKDLKGADLHLQSSRRNVRYYLETPESAIQCRNCDQRGHLARNCPEPMKEETCHLCGLKGHSRWTCPNDVCYNCYEVGHIAKTCPAPRKSNYAVCKRCWGRGHNKNRCPEAWRQYHLTVIESDGLKKPKLDRNGVMKTMRTVRYCFNCGEEGHFGHDCGKERQSRRPVHSPFTVHYDRCPFKENSSKERDRKEKKIFSSSSESPRGKDELERGRKERKVHLDRSQEKRHDEEGKKEAKKYENRRSDVEKKSERVDASESRKGRNKSPVDSSSRERRTDIEVLVVRDSSSVESPSSAGKKQEKEARGRTVVTGGVDDRFRRQEKNGKLEKTARDGMIETVRRYGSRQITESRIFASNSVIKEPEGLDRTGGANQRGRVVRCERSRRNSNENELGNLGNTGRRYKENVEKIVLSDEDDVVAIDKDEKKVINLSSDGTGNEMKSGKDVVKIKRGKATYPRKEVDSVIVISGDNECDAHFQKRKWKDSIVLDDDTNAKREESVTKEETKKNQEIVIKMHKSHHEPTSTATVSQALEREVTKSTMEAPFAITDSMEISPSSERGVSEFIEIDLYASNSEISDDSDEDVQRKKSVNMRIANGTVESKQLGEKGAEVVRGGKEKSNGFNNTRYLKASWKEGELGCGDNGVDGKFKQNAVCLQTKESLLKKGNDEADLSRKDFVDNDQNQKTNASTDRHNNESLGYGKQGRDNKTDVAKINQKSLRTEQAKFQASVNVGVDKKRNDGKSHSEPKKGIKGGRKKVVVELQKDLSSSNAAEEVSHADKPNGDLIEMSYFFDKSRSKIKEGSISLHSRNSDKRDDQGYKLRGIIDGNEKGSNELIDVVQGRDAFNMRLLDERNTTYVAEGHSSSDGENFQFSNILFSQDSSDSSGDDLRTKIVSLKSKRNVKFSSDTLSTSVENEELLVDTSIEIEEPNDRFYADAELDIVEPPRKIDLTRYDPNKTNEEDPLNYGWYPDSSRETAPRPLSGKKRKFFNDASPAGKVIFPDTKRRKLDGSNMDSRSYVNASVRTSTASVAPKHAPRNATYSQNLASIYASNYSNKTARDTSRSTNTASSTKTKQKQRFVKKKQLASNKASIEQQAWSTLDNSRLPSASNSINMESTQSKNSKASKKVKRGVKSSSAESVGEALFSKEVCLDQLNSKGKKARKALKRKWREQILKNGGPEWLKQLSNFGDVLGHGNKPAQEKRPSKKENVVRKISRVVQNKMRVAAKMPKMNFHDDSVGEITPNTDIENSVNRARGNFKSRRKTFKRINRGFNTSQTARNVIFSDSSWND